jgi:hypothetical protein
LSAEYLALRRGMDTWCALWFWAADADEVPAPRTWAQPSESLRTGVETLARRHRFFHWELEFPDAFRPGRPGFDAVLGNPPWEKVQPESREFFSRHDRLYRTDNKTATLTVQRRLFAENPRIEAD